MSQNPESLSISSLAKNGLFEELTRRVSAGTDVDLVQIFERAVTDFRTVRRNSGHLMILKWCVDSGMDLERRAGWLNQNVVSLAAAYGNDEAVQYMLRRECPDNPFVWASVGEFDRLEQYAVEHDLSALLDENGFNLLFYCVESALGRHDLDIKKRLTRICRLLLTHGVSPHHEVIKQLPVSPAFLCAAYGGNCEILNMLLEHGGITTKQCHLALEHSLEPHQRSGEPFYDIADCIIRHGFNINSMQTGQGRTVLHGAAHRGTITAVSWLLQNGANPNGLDTGGRTPLHLSAQRNTHPSVIQLLIEAGAAVNAEDLSGKTAFDYARENNRTRIVECLVSTNGG